MLLVLPSHMHSRLVTRNSVQDTLLSLTKGNLHPTKTHTVNTEYILRPRGVTLWSRRPERLILRRPVGWQSMGDVVVGEATIHTPDVVISC